VTKNNNIEPIIWFCNWNESSLNPSMRIQWRASLVPAAAVIPAPLAYIKIVAVKTFEVYFCSVRSGRHQVVVALVSADSNYLTGHLWIASMPLTRLGVSLVRLNFTLNKLRCSKQALMPWIILHGIMEKDLGLIAPVARPVCFLLVWNRSRGND
jgi:hypothetical protein